jgi:CheY-like chemotaxis protein
VDDEKIIAESAAMILRWQGFAVESFTDPFEALRVVRMKAPDLLLADIRMPLMSGIELAIQVREDCPHCKILLLTGQAEIDDTLAMFRADGQDFDLLRKPLHPTELLKSIQVSLGLEKQGEASVQVPQ